MAGGLTHSLRTFCYFALHSSFLLLLRAESRMWSLYFIGRYDAACFDCEIGQWDSDLL